MDEERAHRARKRKEYVRRLRPLELRAIRQGDAVDPAVLTEIEDLKANIAGLDMAEAPTIEPEVKAAIRSRFADDLEFLIAQFRGITERQNSTEGRVTALEQAIQSDRDDRPRRQEATDRRFDRIERHARIRLIVQIVGALLGSAALIVLSYAVWVRL